MFHQMVCNTCDGNGSLNAKTGELINKEMMVFALKKENKRLKEVLAYLKSLCACEAKVKGHWDTFKSKFGGKNRGD